MAFRMLNVKIVDAVGTKYRARFPVADLQGDENRAVSVVKGFVWACTNKQYGSGVEYALNHSVLSSVRLAAVTDGKATHFCWVAQTVILEEDLEVWIAVTESDTL